MAAIPINIWPWFFSRALVRLFSIRVMHTFVNWTKMQLEWCQIKVEKNVHYSVYLKKIAMNRLSLIEGNRCLKKNVMLSSGHIKSVLETKPWNHFSMSYLTDSYISFTLKLESRQNFCSNRSIRSSTYDKINISNFASCRKMVIFYYWNCDFPQN